MGWRRWTVAAATAACLGLAGVVGANAFQLQGEPGSITEYFTLCSEAQIDIANMDAATAQAAGIRVTTKVYEDFTDFVNSKSGADPATKQVLVTALVEYADPEKTEPVQFRCKLRTAESMLLGAWPAPELSPNGPRFDAPPFYGFGTLAPQLAAQVPPVDLNDLVTSTTDQTCRTVHDDLIDQVFDGIEADGLDEDDTVFDRGQVETVPDQVELIGPIWTQPFDGVVADAGTLRIQSKTILVPTTDTQLGPRFRGAHYCTFVAPSHLRDVLLGAVAP